MKKRVEAVGSDTFTARKAAEGTRNTGVLEREERKETKKSRNWGCKKHSLRAGIFPGTRLSWEPPSIEEATGLKEKVTLWVNGQKKIHRERLTHEIEDWGGRKGKWLESWGKECEEERKKRKKVKNQYTGEGPGG